MAALRLQTPRRLASGAYTLRASRAVRASSGEGGTCDEATSRSPARQSASRMSTPCTSAIASSMWLKRVCAASSSARTSAISRCSCSGGGGGRSAQLGWRKATVVTATPYLADVAHLGELDDQVCDGRRHNLAQLRLRQHAPQQHVLQKGGRQDSLFCAEVSKNLCCGNCMPLQQFLNTSAQALKYYKHKPQSRRKWRN